MSVKEHLLENMTPLCPRSCRRLFRSVTFLSFLSIHFYCFSGLNFWFCFVFSTPLLFGCSREVSYRAFSMIVCLRPENSSF